MFIGRINNCNTLRLPRTSEKIRRWHTCVYRARQDRLCHDETEHLSSANSIHLRTWEVSFLDVSIRRLNNGKIDTKFLRKRHTQMYM